MDILDTLRVRIAIAMDAALSIGEDFFSPSRLRWIPGFRKIELTAYYAGMGDAYQHTMRIIDGINAEENAKEAEKAADDAAYEARVVAAEAEMERRYKEAIKKDRGF